MSLHYTIRGGNANEVAASIERAILSGALAPGRRLPALRDLSARLRLSLATTASAYRKLQGRGLIVAGGRRGTVVADQAPLAARPDSALPAGVRDLSRGGPDLKLTPPLAPALARLTPAPVNYGAEQNHADLLALAARMFTADSIADGPIAVVGGAMDGIERVATARLRTGDRIAIEDPGYHVITGLCRALGLGIAPVEVDDFGMTAAALERALRGGANALVLTPRAQNPLGAALDDARAGELRRLLRHYPEVLVIEDDHAGPVAASPALSVIEPGRPRWAVVRSVAKWLGPDLRLALLTGDELTVGRVQGRQRLGTGWVSHLLQQVVAALCRDRSVMASVRRAAQVYARRRTRLIGELGRRGIRAHGRSGLNVWVPVPEEAAAMRGLLQAGWAVTAGERFRLRSAPALRISIGALDERDAPEIAAALAKAVEPARTARSA